MPELRLFLLGPPRIERDGALLDIHRQKDIALLAYLAVGGANPGRERHTREALVTLLWPELEPSRARAGLRRNLSALRRTLGEEWLLVDRETVGLNPEAGLWLDVERFRDLLRSGSDDLDALEEAVALYRGDFLEGFSLPDSARFDD